MTLTVTHLGLLAGTLTSIAVLPQVFRTWRTRHARDLSIWQMILVLVGMALWLAYGFCLGDLPLIAANIFSLFWYTVLIVMKIVFDRADVRRAVELYTMNKSNEEEKS
jgi:MtN3 and saliva related transmembrane protein